MAKRFKTESPAGRSRRAMRSETFDNLRQSPTKALVTKASVLAARHDNRAGAPSTPVTDLWVSNWILNTALVPLIVSFPVGFLFLAASVALDGPLATVVGVVGVGCFLYPVILGACANASFGFAGRGGAPPVGDRRRWQRLISDPSLCRRSDLVACALTIGSATVLYLTIPGG